MTLKTMKTEREWRQQLTEQEYEVTRRHQTEPAFTGMYCSEKRAGTYRCVCCGAPLFSSETKFASETAGWPTFYAPLEQGAVGTVTEFTQGLERAEVHCTECEAHLGHMFEDGPEPTRQRYCINSAALTFEPEA